MTVDVELGGRVHAIDVRRDGAQWLVTLDGRLFAATVAEVGGRWSLLIAADRDPAGGARSYEVAIEPGVGGERLVHIDGHIVPVVSGGPRGRRRLPSSGAGAPGPAAIVAPMPGRIVKVLVKPGDLVESRQGLVVVEAMKMENELRAAQSGTVTDVRVTEGMSVEAGAVLVVVS